MRALRIKTVVTVGHRLAAVLPKDFPAGEVELLVLADGIPEMNDPDDLADFDQSMKAFEAEGRKTVPFDQVCRELGIGGE